MIWSDSEVLALAWGSAVLLCGATIVLSWLARRWKYRDRAALAAEPLCLQCGYIMRRGGSVVCPECGSDVRERGIVTPRTLPPGAEWPWVLMAAVLALPVTLPVARWVAPRQPFGWSYSVSQWMYLDEMTESGEVNPAFHRFTVQSGGSGRHFGRTVEYLMVYDQPPFGSSRASTGFQVRLSDMFVLQWDRATDRMRAEPLRRAVVEEYVGRVAPAAPVVERRWIAEEIEARVRAQAGGQFPSHDQWVGDADDLPRESVSYVLRDRAWVAVALACYAAVLGAAVWGLRRIFARRRRWMRARWRRAAWELSLLELERKHV